MTVQQEAAFQQTPPPPLLSPFGQYPNPLGIDDSDRKAFHPVVTFPNPTKDNQFLGDYRVTDWTILPARTGKRQLASEQERHAARLRVTSPPCCLEMALALDDDEHGFAVGRYDEKRLGLYESELFENTDHAIDGFKGKRTIHIGMDLGGPVGTPVHAFGPGVICQMGYNAERGDYGNVIVVEHQLTTRKKQEEEQVEKQRVLYALYGHLSGSSIVGKTIGQNVQAGDILGYMGDIHENGGWFHPHVHFQLSLTAPETHDMPGVVSDEDRPRALLEYPDPRCVLGPLY